MFINNIGDQSSLRGYNFQKQSSHQAYNFYEQLKPQMIRTIKFFITWPHTQENYHLCVVNISVYRRLTAVI